MILQAGLGLQCAKVIHKGVAHFRGVDAGDFALVLALHDFPEVGEAGFPCRAIGDKKQGGVMALHSAVRYPHKLDNANAPEAVELLSKTLAAQPDGTVVLVQVGFFYNFASLLDTPADRELIQKKVRLLCLMGGAFQTIDGNTNKKQTSTGV